MAHERTDSYVKDSTSLFQYYKKLGENAIAQCPDAGLFATLEEENNSIAIVVKHMTGNMLSRWTDFLTTDGEKASRNRDSEFVEQTATRANLLKMLDETVQDCAGILDPLPPERLRVSLPTAPEA